MGSGAAGAHSPDAEDPLRELTRAQRCEVPPRRRSARTIAAASSHHERPAARPVALHPESLPEPGPAARPPPEPTGPPPLDVPPPTFGEPPDALPALPALPATPPKPAPAPPPAPLVPPALASAGSPPASGFGATPESGFCAPHMDAARQYFCPLPMSLQQPPGKLPQSAALTQGALQKLEVEV